MLHTPDFFENKKQLLTKVNNCFLLAEKEGLLYFVAHLLVHPNASHFGTGLRTNTLKTIINRFLNACCPLWVRILSQKQKASIC